MFRRLDIPDVIVFTPKRFSDPRGYFVETFNASRMEPMTGPIGWVQDNTSLSRPAHVLRGLHYQTPPHAQDKLVRCVRGRILDVAVDIRAGSPTYGQHVSAVLTADGGEQIFIPKGFAHGFLTLEPDTEIAYKVSNYYSPECDRSLLWNDPRLGIDWGVDADAVTLSDKDRAAPVLDQTPAHFTFAG